MELGAPLLLDGDMDGKTLDRLAMRDECQN